MFHIFGHKEMDRLGIHLSGWSSNYIGIFYCSVCKGKFFLAECTDAFGGKKIVPIPENLYNDLRTYFSRFQGFRISMDQNNEIHIKTKEIFTKYGMSDKYPFNPPTPLYKGEI